jgi:hypothetical protein
MLRPTARRFSIVSRFIEYLARQSFVMREWTIVAAARTTIGTRISQTIGGAKKTKCKHHAVGTAKITTTISAFTNDGFAGCGIHIPELYDDWRHRPSDCVV